MQLVHITTEFEPHPCESYSIQHYVIKFANAIGRWISPVTTASSTNKTHRHYITEILVKEALKKYKCNHNHDHGQYHVAQDYYFLTMK